MSGPDRRETVLNKGFVGGADPELDMDEDFTVTIVGGRRAYHIRCDVEMPLAVDESSFNGFFQRDDIDLELQASLSIYDWNGQEVFDSAENGVRQSRAEYTALDVAGEFITEED